MSHNDGDRTNASSGTGLRRRLAAGLGAFLLVGCGSDTPIVPVTPVPETVTLSATALTFTALGAVETVSATVGDQFGATMPGQKVLWSSSAPFVASVSPSGEVRSGSNGSAVITAVVGSATATVSVTVAQEPRTLTKTSVDGWIQPYGSLVKDTLEVLVADSLGHPVADVAVLWTVKDGGGTIVPLDGGRTDGHGVARARWRLGSEVGAQSVGAALTTPALHVVFLAEAGEEPELAVWLPWDSILAIQERLSVDSVSGTEIGIRVTAEGSTGALTGGRTAGNNEPWTVTNSLGADRVRVEVLVVESGTGAVLYGVAPSTTLHPTGETLVGPSDLSWSHATWRVAPAYEAVWKARVLEASASQAEATIDALVHDPFWVGNDYFDLNGVGGGTARATEGWYPARMHFPNATVGVPHTESYDWYFYLRGTRFGLTDDRIPVLPRIQMSVVWKLAL